MAGRHFLPNVRRQFQSLNQRGDRIGVMEGFDRREFRDKRYTIFHKAGGRNNHFQGVQRLGNYLLVAGSYPYKRKRSDLFVFRLASRASDPGPWGSNLMRSREPPEVDELVNYFRIDDDYWHPGGFNLLDNVAVIPLERSDAKSKIVFVDLSDPEKPVRLPDREIDRPMVKGGALAITPLADGRLLLVVYNTPNEALKEDGEARFQLDVYLSDGPDSAKPFALVAQFFPGKTHDFFRQFQCLDFVWEADGNGKETLYLIGFENTSGAQPNPVDPGENRAYLFELTLDRIPPVPDDPIAELPDDFLVQREVTPPFDTSDHWCNMDAGSCAYIDSNQQLIVYSVYHFISSLRGSSASGGTMVAKALEYRATDFGSPITLIEDAWVDLYGDPGFKGRRLSLLGPWDSAIENTQRIYVDDKKFTATASIRYQLPDGRAYVLYPDKEYGGHDPLVLTGTGAVVEVDVGQTGFGGAFGSSRLQPESVAVAVPGAIVI
jgi:hypothetical protein